MVADFGAGNVADRRLLRARMVSIVRELLASKAETVEELVDRCTRACARHRVTAVLADEGGVHPAVEMLVAHGMRGHQRRGPDELERHLPLCVACTEALRHVSGIERAAMSWQPEEDVGDEPTDRGRRRGTSRSSRSKASRHKGPGILAAWPAVGLVCLLTWWGWNRGEDKVLEVDRSLASLVDRTAPTPPPPSTVPPEARDALRDLRRGDCVSASARLRVARRRSPHHVEVQLLEGASFVCAGNGAKALDAVAPLEGVIGGGTVPWIQGRAHLLLGQAEPAREYLRKVVKLDSVLGPRASALLTRMDAVGR